MKITERIAVPTGDILLVTGEHGPLEMLSLGDYGKAVNIKCDALGLSREPSPVRHTALLPLTEKWVITISTQYGCSMDCSFCDVPRVGPGRNATVIDLVEQVEAGMSLHPDIASTTRLNVHFARMGEPTFNPAVIDAAIYFRREWPAFNVHPVVSTMMPRSNRSLPLFLHDWMKVKNEIYRGNAGLQISINSTDEGERHEMFGGCAGSLADVAHLLAGAKPKGRKVTLNFAVAGWRIDPDVLLSHFSPTDYLVKLTPMHKTATAEMRNIHTAGDYTEMAPYRNHEEALKRAGYDVLVFIASHEEDDSRITCGNAILAERGRRVRAATEGR